MGIAARYFFNASDSDKPTLHRRCSPTDEQQDNQIERWRSLAEFLKTDLRTRSGYPVRTYLQGSYKFETQIRPVKKGDEFDIDLGALL